MQQGVLNIVTGAGQDFEGDAGVIAMKVTQHLIEQLTVNAGHQSQTHHTAEIVRDIAHGHGKPRDAAINHHRLAVHQLACATELEGIAAAHDHALAQALERQAHRGLRQVQALGRTTSRPHG